MSVMNPLLMPLLRPVRWLLLLTLALSPFGPAPARAAEGTRTLTGEIGGALYTILRPVAWNGRVLLLARGFADPRRPLSASLDATRNDVATLLGEGWIVATTSYRRNGLIIRDAITDLDALCDHIAHVEGKRPVVLVQGSSMGGLIATLLMERDDARYAGAVAIGAAVDLREPNQPLVPTGKPLRPLLFLSNRSETSGPAAYCERAAGAPVVPALWTVARDGHVNVTPAERLAAVRALAAWIDGGRIDPRRDGTLVPDPAPGTSVFEKGSARNRVTEVSGDFGNLGTGFVADDLEQLGIRRGDTFLLVSGSATVAVRYGTAYSDVPEGEWIAFADPAGLVTVARNLANAAETVGAGPGTELRITHKPGTGR